jgi:hypothetical protein
MTSTIRACVPSLLAQVAVALCFAACKAAPEREPADQPHAAQPEFESEQSTEGSRVLERSRARWRLLEREETLETLAWFHPDLSNEDGDFCIVYRDDEDAVGILHGWGVVPETRVESLGEEHAVLRSSFPPPVAPSAHAPGRYCAVYPPSNADWAAGSVEWTPRELAVLEEWQLADGEWCLLTIRYADRR